MHRVDVDVAETDTPGAPAVEHFVHDSVYKYAVERFAHERMIKSLQPSVSVIYNGVQQTGSFPLGQHSVMQNLGNIDRTRIDNFVASCAGGLVDSSIVTCINDLVETKEFAVLMSQDCGLGNFYSSNVGLAFINPYHDVKHNHRKLIQVSAQFDAVVLSRDAKPLTLQFKCLNKQPVTLRLSGNDVYKEFDTKCSLTTKRLLVLRKLYHDTVRPVVKIQSTKLAGHKIQMHLPCGSFLTIYIVRSVKIKRTLATSRLAIVAVDALVDMEDWQAQIVPSNECAVCMEVMGGCVWNCRSCKNTLHSHCASAWKNTRSTCPLCRAPM